MENELEKIDLIRSRFKVSYEDARNALAATQGDAIGALAALEKDPPEECRTDLLTIGVELFDEVQRLVAGGPIRKLRVRYGDKLIAEMPVALTAVAALAVGVGAILVSRLIIEVDKSEEEATR